jgi:hypothetical protein
MRAILYVFLAPLGAIGLGASVGILVLLLLLLLLPLDFYTSVRLLMIDVSSFTAVGSLSARMPHATSSSPYLLRA